MSGLDMSRLCDNWMPTEGNPELVASLPFTKILKLDVEFENCLPVSPRILLLQAEAEGQEIWGLRLWNGRLRLTTSNGSRESPAMPPNTGSRLGVLLSYNPEAGGLTILYNRNEEIGGSFSANTWSPWISRRNSPYYTLRIGASKHYVDTSPLGWTITANLNLCNPPLSTEAQASRTASRLVEASPLDNLRLALQSIDSWRKVAEGALEALEKGAPS